MSPAHLRSLGVPWNQPEDRKGLLGSRRLGFGKHGEWQETQGYHAHTLTQQTPQDRGLDRFGSSSSSLLTPEKPVSMEHRKKEIQPGLTLGRTWGCLGEDMSQRYIFQGPYGNDQRLEFQKALKNLRREGI
ncbi:hypothetical protein O181_002046 [Austropuccinia psidii MF-1]|uniref:Uncharacterized protein n=1 Tax=Austropuccinia psidii MF-1 TaxID=1389203 RepID=A0A9Q3BB95_9BASI|nr:hypothetical protein [Austropuccinia psidii MF-1]